MGADTVTEPGAEGVVSAVDGDDILLAAGLIGHRGLLAAGRERIFP